MKHKLSTAQSTALYAIQSGLLDKSIKHKIVSLTTVKSLIRLGICSTTSDGTVYILEPYRSAIKRWPGM